MKPIDKKDQPKLFALIGMAVLAFGFGAYQFATSSTAKPNPGPTPTPAAKTASAGGPGDPAVVEDKTSWKPEGQLDVIPIGGRDPFMPEGLAAPQPSPSPTPAPKPTPGGGGGPIAPPMPSIPRPGGNVVIPPPNVPPMDLGQGGIKTTLIKATPTPPPPAPTLDLSGVIVAEDDSRSKAIFKTDKTNRILGIGDAAGNGWRIADIQERKVEIIDPKTGRRATVELE